MLLYAPRYTVSAVSAGGCLWDTAECAREQSFWLLVVNVRAH